MTGLPRPADRAGMRAAVGSAGGLPSLDPDFEGLFATLAERAPDLRPALAGARSRLVDQRAAADDAVATLRLREAQVRLQAAALDTAAIAVVLFDPGGRILWVNPVFTRLTGYDLEEASGQSPQFYQPEEANPVFYQAGWPAVLDGQPWRGELNTRHKDGALLTVEQTITPIRAPDGTISHLLSVGADITAQTHDQALLRHQATHDALTGLLNRYTLQDAVARAVTRARRGAPSVLLFLDVDRFKTVNDLAGHNAGDQVLVMLAQLLLDQLREGDLLARLGGDEFVVLLEGTGPEQAEAIAARMRAVVAQAPFNVEGGSFDLTLSVGLVPIDGRQSTEALLAAADVGMYQAKAEGRTRATIARSRDDSVAWLAELHDWATRVEVALREDRLLLYFQPVLQLHDRRVTQYEALLRMRGLKGEIIAPGTFLPAAERFGLMPLVDRWTVHRVIRLLRRHPQIHVVVNLSYRSHLDEGLADFIAAKLRAWQVPAQQLGFEIPEAAAMQDLAGAESWIRRLTALGCRVALDDFGLGFSSVAYLRDLPVHQIKIGGAFVRTLDQNPASQDIVRRLHDLARSLDKESIAISVENEATVQLLRGMGVRYGQGYHLSRPAPSLPPT